ncbi:CoF synthetase [Facklamia sp. DSM 111018]|uniref:CoF synthetase n=1 Tax=Facklamia lactis TaxID=2749967 RepID=A0ABS0LRT7_9LACT|nr:F390 synthetase-related protein [Facklamia lactis]MBG9986876.1 CoF synthetase [Facklamia lactis]
MILDFLKTFYQTRYQMKTWSKDQLKAYQEKMLHQHLAFLEQHSPFYQGVSWENFDQIPIVNKKRIMDQYDQMNTRGLVLEPLMEAALESERTRDFSQRFEDISVGLSSGTSGHRGIYTLSRAEEIRWAGNALAKFLPQGKWLGHRIAFFMRANNNLYSSLNSPFLSLDYFDIEQAFDSLMERLANYDPSILIAPASVLYDIWQYFDQNPCPHLIKVISVAEVLEEAYKDDLAQFFNVPFIDQAYQCTEGFLGYTCHHGSFHLCEDVVYFEREWLDERRFIPIVTDFNRRVQPIIRYRLNDILVAGSTCACGSPLATIEKIEGREDDAFRMQGIEGKEVTIYADFIRRALLFVEGISRYRVTQLADAIVIELEDAGDERIQSDLTSELEKLFAHFQVQPLPLKFETLKRQRTTKLNQVRVNKEQNYETFKNCES